MGLCEWTVFHPDDSRDCHLGEKVSLQKRPYTVPKWSEMQLEYKEKQEDAKGKLQSDIQCTFCKFSEQRTFLHTTSYNFFAV